MKKAIALFPLVLGLIVQAEAHASPQGRKLTNIGSVTGCSSLIFGSEGQHSFSALHNFEVNARAFCGRSDADYSDTSTQYWSSGGMNVENYCVTNQVKCYANR